jgi:hypothetical protein
VLWVAVAALATREVSVLSYELSVQGSPALAVGSGEGVLGHGESLTVRVGGGIAPGEK